MSETETFLAEVERHIEGHDDIRIEGVRAGGVSGWEDMVYIACGKTVGFVFKLYDREGCSVEQQMANGGFIDGLRNREAKRLADEEALMSTVARFYV
jgi:hypothetical protein